MIARIVIPFAVMAAFSAVADAQVATDTSPSDIAIGEFDPTDAVAPISTIEGPGVKIGEGTVLRPVFGLESGVVSNVFYVANDPTASALLRVTAQLSVASLGADRLETTPSGADDPQLDQGGLQYRVGIRAGYDEYLSGDGTVRDTSGLGLGASLHALANSAGAVSFGVDDDFNRLIRAANFETTANTNRDINSARLVLNYHPRNHSVGGYLYYQNYLDIFERSQQQFADRVMHTVGIHPSWRWLPQTTVFADVSMGYVTALDSTSMKVNSYPLVAQAGLLTLLSVKTTLGVEAGYANGFYERGPSFSGPLFGANVGYRYSELGRVIVGYNYTFSDSINANYYTDHVLYASLFHKFDPFVLALQPELHLRQYDGVSLAVPGISGPDTRNDVIFATVAGLRYVYRGWLAATLDYRFTTVQTDYRYTPTAGMVTDPSFVRHEFLAGVRVAM